MYVRYINVLSNYIIVCHEKLKLTYKTALVKENF
jgi:hypothetical protein